MFALALEVSRILKVNLLPCVTESYASLSIFHIVMLDEALSSRLFLHISTCIAFSTHESWFHSTLPQSIIDFK